MNDPENENPFLSIHLPVTLIALALTLYFTLNLSGAKQTSENLRWQNENGTKQIARLKEQKEANAKALKENEKMVATAEQTTKQFGDIMTELLQLAKEGDKDAELVVKAYGISQAGGEPAAAEEKKEEPKKEGAQ